MHNAVVIFSFFLMFGPIVAVLVSDTHGPSISQTVKDGAAYVVFCISSVLSALFLGLLSRYTRYYYTGFFISIFLVFTAFLPKRDGMEDAHDIFATLLFFTSYIQVVIAWYRECDFENIRLALFVAYTTTGILAFIDMLEDGKWFAAFQFQFVVIYAMHLSTFYKRERFSYLTYSSPVK